ncbi:ankyrin repeat domain-containing protein 26-like isoform X2 [Mytilus californianus]|uniref:ankyrin repeat domain-containing protein 26-like isoform X2 n=1 Tax=Mytilus californianus TaxID=6549 RepID=UPI002245652E|nr:ankyrin repeat domain-containing protein 26-like isoform X2 [Mytilus californianus]
MKKFFGKLGKKKGEPGRPTPPPSPNLGAIGATGGVYVGYEVREKDLPKLHKAVWNDDLAKVKSLVKKDANGLDKENRTPLHLACVKGSKPIVQELLEWHAKPNIGDNEGKTPLLKAVECKNEDCVMLLLQHTADVDTRDRLGDTAVHVAVKNSYTNILRLLIKSGAEINIRNKSGFAPLHLAVKNKKDEVTKILLQNKADFDVMDGDGRTPLMYACYEGAITQVKDLITVGADTQIKDTKGFNAEDIANQKGQHACSHLLIEHNNKQSGSVASTPRMPSISSRTNTPRQESSDLMFGLPATNMANDYDSDEDGTFSKSAGDDSWKSDADMSLSLHGKRTGGLKLPSPTLDDTDEEVEMPREEGATPKVNLAKALNRITTGSDASDNEALRSCLRKNSSFSDKEGDSEGHDIPVKRLSAKSIQSVTSAEIEWSDEDENSPVNTPRKSSSSKVSFIDKDVSEIHEITATESETDDGGEYQGSEAKRPKYDHTFQQQQNSGYTPTGLTGVANDELSQQKLRVENEYANGTDFMKDIGLEDDDVDDFTSTPDISEMSEPIETAPKPPENPPTQSKQHDSDWDSTEPGITPRTQKSILKTSNRQYEGETQQQIQPKKQPLSPRSDEETSEWDSDVEDMLDPKKKKDIKEGMNIDQESPRHLGKRYEVHGDGSVSGIGDSPIVIRETQDLTEDNIPKTPVSLEKETPKAMIEESEDEQQNIIDFDRTDSWDSDTDGFNTADEQVDGNKMFEIGEDGSIQGVGMSPIELHDDEDQEVDSEVAEVFKAEDDKSLSYKEDISHSVKQILPSPGEGQDEGQPSKEFNLVLDEGRESQGFDLDVHDEDHDSSSIKNQEELESQRPSFIGRQEAVEEFVEQSISQNIGGHSESGGSNWDSSNDAATPRGPPSRLTTSAIVVGVDEDEEDDDFDEEAEVPVQVPVHKEVVEEPQQEVMEETVDALNHTGGSHISYVTTDSHSSKNTVIQVTKDQDQDQPEDEEDEDSEWDSDEDIDCVDNVSPPIGVSPIVRGSEFSVEEEEDEDEESVSEWELERLREKEHKQKLEEEAERRREEELERQREAERLAEQEEWEELQRQEQLKREEEEEALRQKLEEEEALKRQMEEDAQRQRMEEEARRQQLEEAHRQQLEEEAHKQHLEEEAHRQQLEEEAHRQEEERQKKEQIQKNGSDKLTKKNSFKDEETSSPRRFEMRRVNLLSVTDFLKSTKSEIYKANVTMNKAQQKEGTSSKPVVEESLEKADDLMSFTAPVSAPVVKETASAVQSSYSATPIVEETIQKEDKSRSYTSMKGQVEESVTSFSSRQPIKTTNTKRDVEKSIDSSKEQKRRPMSLESIDITADDDDESVDMDHVADPERQDMGSYLRTLPSSYSAYKYNGFFDDDLISLTSTEVDDSMTYQPNTPYGKDILANMNLSDPGTVLKLQDHMHEQNKRLDHERNARITMENKYKSLFKEKNELQKKADGLNQQRSNLEQEKLDLETRIRNLDYKLSEESEMRKNAETLLSKTKDQLNKKEEQYTSEIEAKQAAELQMRNLQMELRSANNSIKQMRDSIEKKKKLEEEKEEYQQQAQHEKNARQMQEQINEEQHRLHEQLQFKQAEIASKQESVPFDAENQLEVADEDRKHAHDSLSILRAELTALKSELEKERKRRRDEASMMSGESEELQGRIEDLKNENKMTEDALTKATMAHSLQVSNLNTEITIINSQYEKERASKEKVDAELESLKTRLQSSSWEVDKAEQARSEVERRLQYEKEEWTKQLENSQKDNTLLKDQQQTLLHRLSSLEAKLNSVENELHVANTSLLERTNQLQQCQKDLEYYKSAQDNYDQNYKLEKEHNSKLQTKVEGLQEKVTGFQHENLTLKQQLESLQHVLSDRSGEDAHEKFTSMLASLKTENEKARLNLEERNSSLSEQVTKLKDENRSLEGRRGNLEQDNQRLNREYTDMFKKLSVAEASHEVSSKAKEHLDSEKHKLAMDLERTQQKYETAQQKCLELQTRVTEITEHVKKAENVRDQARAELMNTSLNQDEGNKIRQDLEGTLHHIQIDNARLDAELKHERQRVEQLQKDLQDSQKVRSSMEALCSNLKSANNMLEDKREHVQSDNSMDDEVTTRVLLTQEAEENKELWEKEVISRSKLGLRVSQYEKQRQEALSHLEEERRKARKATEKVKIAETKLEAEQEKNVELQKELATMKGYLKMAKRKLKVLDTSDSRVNTIITEFDKERLTMEGTLSEARQQIASLQQTLESEADEKEKLHSKNVHLQTKIASLKHLEKNVDKLENSKYKLEEDYKMYKAKIENSYVNKDELNQKEKELEAHYRLQLNRKLDEINNYLEQQARARERLDNSRDETEYKIKDARRKLEDENTSLKIQNEQIKAQKDSKEMEAKRFRDLYDSEMQWRMRLSEQLVRTTDKAYGYKSKLVAERQRGRIQNNLSFSSPVNGNALDYSRLSMNGDDILSNRLRVELDRSIAKHLEAAPHDNIQPAIRTHDDSIMNSSFAKSSAEYLELLKRKYCV